MKRCRSTKAKNLEFGINVTIYVLVFLFFLYSVLSVTQYMVRKREYEDDHISGTTSSESVSDMYETEDKSDKNDREVPHTDEEVIMMEYIVECEAHTLSLEHKTLIACVIVNRLYSDLWDYDSISEVILDKNQFSSLFNYYERVQEPDEDTKEAVRSVLSGEVDRDEVSDGALFFYNPTRAGGYISFFEKRELVREMDGHRFFR